MPIELNPTLFIAKGRDCACYHHPLNPALCIKIGLGAEKQSRREKAYFNYLRKHRANTTKLSTYQGEIATNLGVGYLFELALNQNKTLAPTLKHAIVANLIKKSDLEVQLHEFKNYLINNRICVKDLSPSNLACQLDEFGNFKLTLIDGIGSPNLNPITIRSQNLTLRAIHTAWARLERKINQLYSPQTPSPLKLKRQNKNWLIVLGTIFSGTGIFVYLLVE